MPWDEGLVNSLVYDAPDPKEGRVVSATPRRSTKHWPGAGKRPGVFVLGQGVDDPRRCSGRRAACPSDSDADRVFDTPLSEEADHGRLYRRGHERHAARLHAQSAGFRPAGLQSARHARGQISFHGQRPDDRPDGRVGGDRPGWGSGAQHSQAIHGMLLGVPGLKIVMPSTPYDAKGLLLSAILDNNPVCVFEHRWLMKKDGIVPEGFYRVPIGKGISPTSRQDLTIVGASHAIELALQAASKLAAEGIEADVIDLRTIKPLDERSSASR